MNITSQGKAKEDVSNMPFDLVDMHVCINSQLYQTAQVAELPRLATAEQMSGAAAALSSSPV